MKKQVIATVVVLLLLSFFTNINTHPALSANEKFKGKEAEYLAKCAQRLNEEEAKECREFKVYYQSLGQSILNNQSQLKNEVAELKKDIEKLIEKSNALSKDIDALQSQKQIITNNIKVNENNIQQIQKEIVELKEKIEIRKKEILKRMQDTQLSVTGDRKFAFLLDSADFDDLLRRISILEQISRYDEERIALLRKDQAALANEERELVRQQESLISQRNEIEEKEQQIKVLKEANQELINTYLSNKTEIEKKLREAESNYATIVANASKINTSASKQEIEQISNSNNANQSGFGPVLSGSWTKSAGTWAYPWDFGGGTHLGMDFAGHQGMGQPVLAPADAIVLMTQNGCSDFGGLGNRCGSPMSGGGNWVVLMTEMKGTTYVFIMFHLRSSGITAKNKVSKGEIVGYMGSSGSSTGPHLHLEIITLGNISLAQGYQQFIDSGYNPTVGAGWGLGSRCENKSIPCRIRPETFYE